MSLLKLRPRKLLFGSATKSFSVNPYAATSGKIVAIRVQDIARGKWYNYDNGSWDEQPMCTPGNNLYIAFYAQNEGSPGNLTLAIKGNGSLLFYPKTEHVDTGGTVGVESGTIEMPNSPYNIECKVTP